MIVVIWIVCGKLFHFHFVYVGVLEEVLRGPLRVAVLL